MTTTLEQCLNDLEERIDESVEAELRRQWKQFCRLEFRGDMFSPSRPAMNPPKFAWPVVRTNEILADFDKMALQQFAGCSGSLEAGNGFPLMVRCNYGTPIMPVLFGAELFVMPEEMDCLPGSRPIGGGTDAIKALLDRGEPSLDHPYAQKVLEMGRRFMAVKRAHPKIGRWVDVYHPDLQGPMDVLEMIWGSDIFVALYEEADLVHAMLDLVCRTYGRFMRAWEALCPPPPPGDPAGHWGLMHPGRIMLRDDSAMNLSPEMFRQFILPYDQRLLEEFGGGAIHACGKVDHWAPLLGEMKGLKAFNMSQPHLNDMEIVWQSTVDKGLVIVDVDSAAARAAIAAGRNLHGRVNCRK